MIIDCNDCRMQHTDACHDCVVMYVLHDLVGPLELDDEQAGALDVLSEAGLVAPLRLVPRRDPGAAAAV